ncbi:SURF1 family protein [Nocardioides euryhalodurans]|uniref:SURF1 family protein n=1 Tax=Nocardioides euryhalodurans TaxID=2518370 RepID=UPI001422C73E|nr:SURF1 family protein [Nocardioides euryhalodurans]
MTTPPPSVWAARFWPGHLLCVVLVGVAVWLGAWQWDAWEARRAAEARDLTLAEPVPVADVIGPDDPFPGDRVGQPVVLAGEWLDDGTVFVERESGYWVVTPLAIGGAGEPALPVVRGVAERPEAEPVTGPAELVGWLQPSEGTGSTDPDPSDDVLPQLRVADLVQRVDVDLYGAYAVATEPETGLAVADLEELPESSRFTAARNLFYAIEWWVFGAFALFVWVRYLRDERTPEPATDDQIASGA